MSTSGYIGVDCGSTHCRIAWENDNRRVDYIGPGGNFTTAPGDCAAAITTALEHLAGKADLALAELSKVPAHLAVAGAHTKAQAEELAGMLPLSRAQVASDQRAFVIGALGSRHGCVAALGTGSFFARVTDKGVRIVGGHGLAMGDEASAAWLGREALRWALHAGDGLAEHSAMTRALLEEFGGAHGVEGFAANAAPTELGRLARGVTKAAERGDVVGRALLHRGAGWICRSVRALGWQPGEALCAPGVLSNAYLPHLDVELRDAMVAPDGDALDGALTLARTVP